MTAALLASAGAGALIGGPTGAGAAADVAGVVRVDGTDTGTATTDTSGAATSTPAADSTDGRPATPSRDGDRGPRGDGGMALEELVADGTITQEQADAVTAAVKAAREAARTTDESATSTERPARGEVTSGVLAALVADGTITQAQADAVIAAREAARPDGGFGGDGHGGRGGPGGGFGVGRGASAETAATAIGIGTDELQAELETGKSIADVATEHGVAVQSVIDAIVAEQQTKLVERVTDMVNGVRPERPSRSQHASGDTAADDSSATTGD
ncbi:MAG TPA: hypothetical protein PLV68_02910 [Ilumatobacteraceae bacterium]|nr:hypothetical protein [Ilumatobacteraceae bacterium]